MLGLKQSGLVNLLPYPFPLRGEPDEGGTADEMVFGDETEEAGVRQVGGIVGRYPVVVFREAALLGRLTVDVEGIVLDFGPSVFVQYECVA